MKTNTSLVKPRNSFLGYWYDSWFQTCGVGWTPRQVLIGQAFVGIGAVTMPIFVLGTLVFSLFVLILFNADPFNNLTSIRI